MNLVTGYAGKPHVSSIDHGALNTMIFGNDSFVLPFGERFKASIVQEDEAQARIKIADGDMMVQGRHIRLASGESETINIPKPAQGYYRDDLIVVRYTKDAASGIESCNLALIEGEEDEARLGAPNYVTGDLTDSGCALHEFPLYRLRMFERDILDIEPLFMVKNPLSNINSIPVQHGTAVIEYSATRETSVHVDFPVAFATKPSVIVSQVFNEKNIVVFAENVTETGFTANLGMVGSNGYREFSWIAMA